MEQNILTYFFAKIISHKTQHLSQVWAKSVIWADVLPPAWFSHGHTLKAWKKFRPKRDSDPWLLQYSCSALVHLSYQAIKPSFISQLLKGAHMIFGVILRVPYTFFVTPEWAFLACMKHEWGSIFFCDSWIYISPSSGNSFSIFLGSVKYAFTFAWFLNQRLLRE